MRIDQLRQEVSDLAPFLTKVRRDFHAHPEIGCNEYRTAERIRSELLSFGFREEQIKTGIVKTGIMATVTGAYSGPTILFRADMDALRNCKDISGAPYASQTPNVCHACGHDVHTSIALGTAKLLAEHAGELHGTAKFFFQPSEELPVQEEGRKAEVFLPAEENPYGTRAAYLALKDGVLEGVDRLLGLHCWPSLDAGKIGYEPDVAMAGSGNFHIVVRGRSGHAGTPEQCVDAIALAAEVIVALQTVVSRSLSPSVPVVVNIGAIQGGGRRSTVAGQVDMAGTVRCADSKYLKETVPSIMERIIHGICESAGGTYQFDYCAEIPPVKNDPVTLEHDVTVLNQVMPGMVQQLKEKPMTAEDFAFLAEQRPAAFLKLGTRDESVQTHYALHNGAFDVDEHCLATGTLAVGALILDYLKALEE